MDHRGREIEKEGVKIQTKVQQRQPFAACLLLGLQVI
jgi:hypothetical protein